MRALCWNGINDLRVETVPDPSIVNPHDAIVRVTMSSTCGSDLHFIDGYISTMRAGDVIGHEFMGEVVEVGPEVKRIKRGQRVVVPSPVCCGNCWYCRHDLWSLCDNTNPNGYLQEQLLGYPTAGIYGYTHAFGGYAGSHAQYVRIPHADTDCFEVPEGLRDDQAIFLSDAGPTGYMGADYCGISPGDTIAVWGCGGVGLAAQKAAYLMGAGRVIGIDRYPERLHMAREHAGSETIDYSSVDSVLETLKEMTGADLDLLVRDDVVDQMRIDRRTHGVSAGLDVGQEAQQPRQIVALRKTLFLHQAFAREHRIGIEEAVGGEEIDLGDVRPAGQQRLQNTRGGRLADGDGAGDADDVRHLRVFGAEEALLSAKQPLGGSDIERKEAR